MTIGYGVLTDELNFNIGDITITPQTWDVAFQTETVNGIGLNRGDICRTITTTRTTASIGNHTVTPTGKCYYELKILNNGTIGATIGDFFIDTSAAGCGPYNQNHTDVMDFLCGTLRYRVSSDNSGNNVYSLGESIPASSGTFPVYIVVTGTSSSTVTETLFSLQLTFSQN